MNRVVYIAADSPHTLAARHLLSKSTLRAITVVTPDQPWMGAQASRVELGKPSEALSPEEVTLWLLLDDLRLGDSVVLDIRPCARLPREDWNVVLAALDIAMTSTVELPTNTEQVAS